MTVRDDILSALQDAVEWQMSLADANHAGSPERARALAQERRYRAILKRRYETSVLPMEEKMKDAVSVSIYDIKRTT